MSSATGVRKGEFPPAMTPAKRNLQLDVLRGIAILLVFGRHFELERPDGILGTLADCWFRIGWIGVDLFFVLSGFLIGGLLLTELSARGEVDVTRFLIRRGLKIYPPYLVFIAYLFAMPCAKAILTGGDWIGSLSRSWDGLWANFLFLQNYLGTIAGHTWTLAVEEHFYIILPFFLVLLSARQRIRLLVPICMWSIVFFLGLRCLSVWLEDPFSHTVSATHLRLDALLLGVGLRGISQSSPEQFTRLRRLRWVLFPGGLVLWLPNILIAPESPWVKTVGLTGTLVGSGAILIAVSLTRASDFKHLRHLVIPVANILAWIGVYSYGIYLWHVTALGIFRQQVALRLFAYADSNSGVVWLMAAAALTAGGILTGIITSKCIEWPVIRLRDRIFPSRSRISPIPVAITTREERPVAVSLPNG